MRQVSLSSASPYLLDLILLQLGEVKCHQVYRKHLSQVWFLPRWAEISVQCLLPRLWCAAGSRSGGGLQELGATD